MTVSQKTDGESHWYVYSPEEDLRKRHAGFEAPE